jgi:hypothetical protein
MGFRRFLLQKRQGRQKAHPRMRAQSQEVATTSASSFFMIGINQLYRITIFLSIVVLLSQPVFAQGSEPQIKLLPSSLDEAAKFFLGILKTLPQVFFQTVGEIKEVIKRGWDKYILPKAEKLWQKIELIFHKELLKIKQELKKEQQEIQQDIQQQTEKATKNVWERLKELIKSKL